MNRPRNCQQRPQRDSNAAGRGPRPSRAPPQYDPNVPTIQQVIPGASVSIVLKEDQPTGHEVQGVVKDLLTRGNHPRGIKVRLQDGRVGRVQRMSDNQTSAADTFAVQANAAAQAARSQLQPRAVRMERDARLDEYAEGPPPRSLADYFPDPGPEAGQDHAGNEHGGISAVTAKCPICGDFEGDEVAVSRHIEEHLT